jgi:hypothetical protein
MRSVDAAGNLAAGPLRTIQLALVDAPPPAGGDADLASRRGRPPLAAADGGAAVAGGGRSAAAPRPIRLECGPNPLARGTTTAIVFGAPSGSGGRVAASLAVYDLAGRLVRTLFGGNLAPGEVRAARWDGADGSGAPVGAGIYFARLELGSGETIVRRIVLLR